MSHILFQMKEECGSEVGTHSFCVTTDIHNHNGEKEENCGQPLEKHQSVWTETSEELAKTEHCLDELTEQVDVVVVGAGIAGCLIGYELSCHGLRVCVLDREKAGNGCTKNSTAKITSLHGDLYLKIAKGYGKGMARQYYRAQEKALYRYHQIIHNQNISCDYEELSHTLYATDEIKKLRKTYELFEELKIKAEYVEQTELPFEIQGGIRFTKQAQFHPLKFIQGLKQHIPVYENACATRIDSDGTVYVHGGKKIHAKNVVIATHYPIINSKGFYFMKMSQERSYVCALKQEKPFPITEMYIDYAVDGHTFRPYKDYLIMGAGNHRTGLQKIPDYYKQLELEATKWYPDAKIAYQWSNQDCMSLDGIPYIGQYARTLPNFYVATGFNQWGISNSMVAAEMITDFITCGSSEFETVFSPTRHQVSEVPSFLKSTAVTSIALSKSIFHIPSEKLEDIKPGEAGVVRIEGITAGVYVDESGNRHVVDTKCPHLGCQLQWNPNEKTWDCPCHGSRFDYEGILIEDPAEHGLDNISCKIGKIEQEKEENR